MAEVNYCSTSYQQKLDTKRLEVTWQVRNIETEIAIMASCRCSFKRATEIAQTAKFFGTSNWELNFERCSATRKI